MESVAPKNLEGAIDAIQSAKSLGKRVEICGLGTKRAIGGDTDASIKISSRELNGINFYEPSELVVGVKSGTSLKTVEAVIEQRGQRFVFEPPRLGKLLGATEDEPTIGGLVATNMSGPMRVNRGALRDHLLGFEAVNGRGEPIKSGGRVMKNVTGYDLCKLMASSWGSLALLTDVSLKVMPMQECEKTLVVKAASVGEAIEICTNAMGSPFDLVGAAVLPAAAAKNLGQEGVVALLRLEGFDESVTYRCGELLDQLNPSKGHNTLENAASKDLWAEIRDVDTALSVKTSVMRCSVAPTDGAAVAAQIEQLDGDALLDWSGGLVWAGLRSDNDALKVRETVKSLRGTATLMKSSNGPATGGLTTFSEQAEPIAKLMRGVKTAFDPSNVFASRAYG